MELKAGIVKEVLTNKAQAIVHFEEDGADSWALPVLCANTLKNRSYRLPDVGEQVICLLDSNAEEGVVLGSIYSEADAPPLDDGDKCAMIFEDSTAVQYDRNAHLMSVEFADGTKASYDAASHALRVQVASGGTIGIECGGTANIISNGAMSLSSSQSIALNAPGIALNTASLSCSDPDSELGACSAVFHGNLDLRGDSVRVAARTIQHAGSASLTGNLSVTGSIEATGTITDTGGNTNHHEHPQYQLA